MSDEKPDIMCIQETNFKNNTFKSIKNFDIHFKNRSNCISASGGVATYINKNILNEEIKLNTTLEAVASSIFLQSKKICICNLYLPNSHELEEYEIINLITKLPKPFILLGDLNCHNPLWGSKTTDTRGKKIENILEKLDLITLNSQKPTHFNASNASFSSIDLTICDPTIADSIEWNALEDLYDSDHFPITINVENSSTNIPIHRPRWKFQKADWDLYKSYINENLYNLKKIEETTTYDINEIISNFEELIFNAASKSIPRTTSSISKKYAVWWNEKCELAIKEKKHAKNIFKKHNTRENKIIYNRYKAIAKRVLKESKKQSWRTNISLLTTRTDPNAVWRKLRSINSTHKNTEITALPLQDNEYITDPTEMANALAKAFAKNSSDTNFNPDFLETKNAIENNKTIEESNFFQLENKELDTKITLEELLTTLKKCGDSSPGPDEIPNIFIRELPIEALKYLLEVYNYIWSRNVFPDKWHEATVIPIPKPGKNKLSTEGYRPIALTSCLCKLLEKIINKRLIWYLEKHNIINTHQSGFRQNRSTIDSLITFESDISESFINNEHVASVSLDMEKAYDMVWRRRIIQKLAEHNIVGNTLKFIVNFLKKRYICVRVNGHLSNKVELLNGVPQGSVISVTIFLIAINDIVYEIPKPVKCIMFADDKTIYTSGKNINTTEDILQQTLNQLQVFSNKTGFKFSQSKTTVTIFSRLKRALDINLSLNGHTLQVQDETKILGLTFDKKLNWTTHLKKLKNDCTKRLRILKVIAAKNWGAEHQIIKNTYVAFIRSKIDYGSIIYDSAKKKILDILSPINNTAARLSIGAFRSSPTESILCEAQLPTLECRRKELSLNYALKIASTPKNPCYDKIFSEKFSQKFKKRDKLPKPISHRIKKHAQEINFEIPNILPQSQYQTPPWLLKKPEIIKHATIKKKQKKPRKHQNHSFNKF